jgi:hypothetical protein
MNQRKRGRGSEGDTRSECRKRLEADRKLPLKANPTCNQLAVSSIICAGVSASEGSILPGSTIILLCIVANTRTSSSSHRASNPLAAATTP